MTLVLKPRPGARSTRTAATKPADRRRQPVTNQEWFDRQRAQRGGTDIFGALFTRLLKKVGR